MANEGTGVFARVDQEGKNQLPDPIFAQAEPVHIQRS